MKEIKLTQGQIALVDDEDFERLNQFKWFANKNGRTYYARRTPNINGKKISILMHQLIINSSEIDHLNGNGVDNQRSNLRSCTHKENSRNKRKNKNAYSIYKGVSFMKSNKKWGSRIKCDYKSIHLGFFILEIDAAKAYNNKAIELFGKFANLNIIPNEN